MQGKLDKFSRHF